MVRRVFNWINKMPVSNKNGVEVGNGGSTLGACLYVTHKMGENEKAIARKRRK